MHKDAEKMSIVPGLKINWGGVFNLDDLYKKMKWWLDYEGYGDEKKSFMEKRYVERITAKGKQYEILWETEKNVSDYFSNFITISFLIVGVQDVQGQRDGKSIKMNKGNIILIITGDLIKNRSGKWAKKSVIKKIYEKFVARQRIEDYSIKLYNKIYSFHDEIKSYLNLSEF